MTLSIMTLSVMTLSIMTLSIMTLSITTLSMDESYRNMPIILSDHEIDHSRKMVYNTGPSSYSD
jgi:hypothetical protein